MGGGGKESWPSPSLYHIITLMSSADTGFPEGGGEQIHKHHHPLDIVRVTSPALLKLKSTPTLGHSQAPPPLDISRVTSSTFQGVCVIGPCQPLSRTLCIGFQDQDKFNGGGGVTPVTPLDPPLHTLFIIDDICLF